MEVRLTVIGSSPAWPNPGSAQSGYLVEGEGALLLDLLVVQFFQLLDAQFLGYLAVLANLGLIGLARALRVQLAEQASTSSQPGAPVPAVDHA